MPLLLILTVACCCFNVGLALFDPEATFIKAKDRVTAQDIYMECCDQKWDCCVEYLPNNSSIAATPPPPPRSQKNPECKLAKARREESQALQAVTMLDMYIKIHVEYTELKNLERCFRPKTYELNFKRSELLRKIAKLKSALEHHTILCSYSHIASNHTLRQYEIAKKLTEYLEVRKLKLNKLCAAYGNSDKRKIQFSNALHHLGQQLKGLECLEALSTKRYLRFCEDKCIRRKSVSKCISQWL